MPSWLGATGLKMRPAASPTDFVPTIALLWRQPFLVAGALDNCLVDGVGQSVLGLEAWHRLTVSRYGRPAAAH